MEGNKDAAGSEQPPYTDLIRKTHQRYVIHMTERVAVVSDSPSLPILPPRAVERHQTNLLVPISGMPEGVQCATDGLNEPPKNPEHPSGLMRPLTGVRWPASMESAPCLCLLRRLCSMPGLHDGAGNTGAHGAGASSPPPPAQQWKSQGQR